MDKIIRDGNSVKKQQLCVFKPSELSKALLPTIKKLYIYEHEAKSSLFCQPVDPQALNIPDYFDIIKKPIDLSTIKKKLDTGQYSDPWEYVDDVWLMFDNAWLYNRKTTRVYKHCTELSKVFEQEIDPVMQSLGYCCGRKYTFHPQVLWCYGEQLCTITRNAKYYSYQNRYTFCQKCFSDIPGDTVALGDDPTQPKISIKKVEFLEMKNDHLELEPFVYCSDCKRKFHQICVLHMDSIWPEGYTCDNCLKKKGQKRKNNKFNAKRLPVTKLGTYIETRVNNFLREKESGAGEVRIRVVASSDKVVEVKPGMRSRFVENGDMPDEFPYRAKALFAFEEIDGTDVCFFGMHVQEYGSECSPPNARRVYVAYLDSVHFFDPKQFRTAVYHEILHGYLDYAKQLGYTMAHIWACPPSKGNDYIFYDHPQDQKIPTFKRLQEWYKKMLTNAVNKHIVIGFKDILTQAMEDNISSAADLPYFEGDFWPNSLEEKIKELDKKEEEQRKQDEAAEAAAAATNAIFSTADNSILNQSIIKEMRKQRKHFFVITLSEKSSGPTQDPDPVTNCVRMDGPEAFLTIARKKHLEFSSLRRAKFSSMSLLYELHNQGSNKFTCNNCKRYIETRFHCKVCDDFDLCISCKEKDGHFHELEQLGYNLHRMTLKHQQRVSLNRRMSSMTSEVTSTSSTQTTPMVPEPIQQPIQQQSNENKQLFLFEPDKLREALMPTFDAVYSLPESLPFRKPVDPQALDIPDYFDIIKKPIDLSTIKTKLETGQYSDPLQYCNDMCLMFDNAWLYNKKTTRVYKHCTKLSEEFEKKIDPLMKSLEYQKIYKYQ